MRTIKLYSLGSQLRRFRVNRKLTLQQAESLTGIPHQVICVYENGQRDNPTLRTLAKFAKAYDIHISMLLRNVSTKPLLEGTE